MSAKPSGRKKQGGIKRILKKIGLVLGTLVLIGATTAAILCCYGATYIQDVIMPQVNTSSVNLVASSTSLSSVIYYYDNNQRDYQPLQTLYATENRIWASYDEIPQHLIHATVAIEDKRFYTHHGVDWKRTGAAVLYMFTGQRIEGGSTITQQLIKNLTQQNQVTVRRKVLEIFEALQFDKTHTKNEIIEWYLNEIYLGRGCFGVKTAAQKYFGKDVSELNLAECASLISITNNPSLYDPYNHPENNLKRRKLVLKSMAEQGYISEQQRDEASEQKLTFTIGANKEDTNHSGGSYYSWYTDAVIASVIEGLQEKYDYDEKTAAQLLYSGGFQIYSCLDKDVQEKVDRIYENSQSVEGWDSLKGEQLQSAITIVDNETGAVVALAGGIGEKVGNRIWNRATDTLRQSGSSIKPLSAYAQGLEAGILMPNTILEDSAFTTLNGRAWPKNSHGGYIGSVDMTYAVAHSLNTIAVKIVDFIGRQECYDFLTQKFRLTTLVEDYVGTSGKRYSDIGYSQLALGGLTKGVSTYEMAAAYSTFPREGVYIAPYLYTVVIDNKGEVILSMDGYSAKTDGNGTQLTGTAAGEAILSTSTSYYMTKMLQAVVTNGTGQSAAIDGMPVAGKTGTTDDDYDRWFVGYTPYYTAAVWTGYDRASKIQASYNPAIQLWQQVMSGVSAGMVEKQFGEDYRTVEVAYCGRCGGLAGKESVRVCTMSFIKGDEPEDSCICGGKKKEENTASKPDRDDKTEQDNQKPEEETTTDSTDVTETETGDETPETPSDGTTTVEKPDDNDEQTQQQPPEPPAEQEQPPQPPTEEEQPPQPPTEQEQPPEPQREEIPEGETEE